MLGLGRAGSFGVQVKTKPASWADVKNKKIRGGPIEGIIESMGGGREPGADGLQRGLHCPPAGRGRRAR